MEKDYLTIMLITPGSKGPKAINFNKLKCEKFEIPFYEPKPLRGPLVR